MHPYKLRPIHQRSRCFLFKIMPRPLSGVSWNIHDAVALTLMMYRALPREKTGKSPSYTTYGVDLVTYGRMMKKSNFRCYIACVKGRLSGITTFWNPSIKTQKKTFISIRRFSYFTAQRLPTEEVHPHTSAKLVNEWSLPTRVTLIDRKHVTATLQCMDGPFEPTWIKCDSCPSH